jgi:hypothetical protein
MLSPPRTGIVRSSTIASGTRRSIAASAAEALSTSSIEGERQRRAAMFAEMADGNPLFIEQLAATGCD